MKFCNRLRRDRHGFSLRVFVVVIFSTTLVLSSGVSAQAGPTKFLPEIGEKAVPSLPCRPGDLKETGLQGDVPLRDRESLRSAKKPYNCNMSLAGQRQGPGGGTVSANFEHCYYVGSVFPGNVGVQVLNVKNPAHPRLVTSLRTPAMLGGTWEGLKVNKERKLLVGTSVPFIWGGGFISVYDVSDCEHPRLLNRGPGTATPLPFTSHEGGFSPDGKTYWASGSFPGQLSAIDLTNPRNPHVVWQGLHSLIGHGFGITPDGNRMYLSNVAGITILDISQVQRRVKYPQVPHVAAYLWADGVINQHSIPVTIGGKSMIFTVDEAGASGVKLFDMTNQRKAKQVAQIKLQINLLKNQDASFRSSMGGTLFAYNAHYCSVDRRVDPTALACGWESSGVRVFDIRNINKMVEIGYFNPRAKTGKGFSDLPNSFHAIANAVGIPVVDFLAMGASLMKGKTRLDQFATPRLNRVIGDLSADWCLSPPSFKGNQIWTTCSDNGFMTLNLDPKVYTPPANQETYIGS